jgi:DNA primase
MINIHETFQIKGGHTTELSVKDIEEYLSPTKQKAQRFIIPKHFINIPTSTASILLLKEYNIFYLWEEGYLSFYYDVKQNRLVFPIEKDNKYVNAIGRSLGKEKPKWYIYGNETHPFVVGNYDTAVIVEDCISACRLHSINMTGVAILGTSLKQSYIPTMRKFKKLYVCLDKDATSKAFDIANELMYYVDTEVKILDDDIKYLNQEELKELFQ